MKKVLLSIFVALLTSAASTAEASSVYGFSGSFSDNYVKINLRSRFSSWMGMQNGKRVAGSSKNLYFQAQILDENVSAVKVIYKGKTLNLPDKSEVHITPTSHEVKFPLTLMYTLKSNGKTVLITKKFIVRSDKVRGGSLGRYYLLLQGKASDSMVRLHASRAKWLDKREKSNNSYSYTETHASIFGFGQDKIVKVKYGQVVSSVTQKFKFKNRKKTITQTITQDLENSSSNNKPKTLDQLYEEAENVLLRKISKSLKLIFSFDKSGLLLKACHVDTRVMDDAPCTGVYISSIQLTGP
ncbi:hypothetical protein KKF34_15750 [Myxococcota bacterium]|nr:hypothetical protein [Myxococcota bacterium]MBU1382218.1 hypothetical protein [Myxococcota bacterium]MBU1498330.1 hypothetical protein [Myxococcota bacterium]